MKALIILLFFALPLQAQYNPYSTTHPSAVILVGTFMAVQNCGCQSDRNKIAFTGMVTSVAVHLIIEKVRSNRRIKKLRYI